MKSEIPEITIEEFNYKYMLILKDESTNNIDQSDYLWEGPEEMKLAIDLANRKGYCIYTIVESNDNILIKLNVHYANSIGYILTVGAPQYDTYIIK